MPSILHKYFNFIKIYIYSLYNLKPPRKFFYVNFQLTINRNEKFSEPSSLRSTC
jgi:hypothetical protein